MNSGLTDPRTADRHAVVGTKAAGNRREEIKVAQWGFQVDTRLYQMYGL